MPSELYKWSEIVDAGKGAPINMVNAALVGTRYFTYNVYS